MGPVLCRRRRKLWNGRIILERGTRVPENITEDGEETAGSFDRESQNETGQLKNRCPNRVKHGEHEFLPYLT
ncbi:hypothetical protein Ddye_013161 [Dipteronia dyeriana]|uniref:Uncharacterized protein n=1 Tax=Dipteronia dyeriana TaxID=168575 RepID=A0AAE0CJD6_9ROSI|nr:hypothetical protein Ddye_013161 [Dipteronia dyeriana]